MGRGRRTELARAAHRMVPRNGMRCLGGERADQKRRTIQPGSIARACGGRQFGRGVLRRLCASFLRAQSDVDSQRSGSDAAPVRTELGRPVRGKAVYSAVIRRSGSLAVCRSRLSVRECFGQLNTVEAAITFARFAPGAGASQSRKRVGNEVPLSEANARYTVLVRFANTCGGIRRQFQWEAFAWRIDPAVERKCGCLTREG